MARKHSPAEYRVELVLGPAFWTFWLLVFSFPVTLVLIGVAGAMRQSKSGRALRALSGGSRLLPMSPLLLVVGLWAWAGAFGAPPVHNGIYDSPTLRAAAGWRHFGIYVLLGVQVITVVVVPIRLSAGRLAACAYGALQLWIGAMAAMVAHYAVLGLPVPVL